MLNIGTGEIIFIAVAALLILGPTKLPEFARTIGKLVRDFRRQTDDVRNVVEREFYKMDQQLQEPPAPLPQAAPDAIAHGEHHDALGSGDHHAGELPSGDTLPLADSDLSQVMKGAPPGELVIPRPVTTELSPPAHVDAAPGPAPVEAPAQSTEPVPEKATS